jgi:ubiquinone/menaquinone biosynthesis C-methylase UbiE
MSDVESSVVGDYGTAGLGERILTGLRAFGVDTDNLTQKILAEIDHIHGGGYANTMDHAKLVEFTPDMAVLDIGCGIGGPARYFAQAFGCRVTGIDLTQEYVDVAAMLTERCGLDDRVDFKCANALDLPFDDGSFDGVWCLNVTMNIEDRTGFYGEVRRVLKPGGHFALSELGIGPGGDPYYPLTWAREASYSFLITPDALRTGLEAAGFRITQWIDEAARRKQAGGNISRGTASVIPGGAGMKMIRGDDYRDRQANVAKSIMEDRLTNVRLVAERLS